MSEVDDLDNLSAKDLIKALLHRQIAISDIPTFVLCEELQRRSGVETVWVDPHAVKDIRVEGCAIVYVVRD